MPIYVDHDERRLKIIEAALGVLGDLGLASFTLRAVGHRLGGSVTMVTHYFPTRDELMDAILTNTLEDAKREQKVLLEIADPQERLEAVARYFLPLTEEDLTMERARVALSSHRNTEPLVREHLNLIEPEMREVIRAAIVDFVPAARLDAMVDLIRVWTSGVVLATVEHPEIWTPERQTEALGQFMQLLARSVGTD